MKKVLAIILTMLMVNITVLPVGAAEAVKGTEANPYTFKEIPASWIKTVKKDNIVIGYTITVANNNKATFKLSGTQFKEYSKGKDGKFSKAVALTNGKLRTVKDVSVIRVVLRDKAKKKPASDVPEVNVTTHYQSGMSWSEVNSSINALITNGQALAKSGNLVQSDKVSPTNINVLSSGNSFKIAIYGWRTSKNQSSTGTMDTLKNSKIIMQFFYGSAGNSAFSWYDAMMTSGDADPADYGFTDTDPTSSTTTLIHNKTGTRIGFTQGNGYDSFYFG